MGLDMYLNARRYVKNWEYMKPEERHSVLVKKNNKTIKSKLPVKAIEYEAAYWRKANAIHEWFVKNVQDGEDDCREYYVSKAQLETLLSLCKQVKAKAKLKKGKIKNGYTFKDGEQTPIMEEGEYIENAEEISQILPTQGGFFFGSTEYDQWYMGDIESTINMLEEALAESDELDFYYESSW